MSIITNSRRAVRLLQALPDRHLQGLYGLLALFIAVQVRRNTPDAAATIIVAFFFVGIIRAIKHPEIVDLLFSLVVGFGVGFAASACVRALEPQLISDVSGKLLGAVGALTFAWAAGIVTPLISFLRDDRPPAGGPPPSHSR